MAKNLINHVASMSNKAKEEIQGANNIVVDKNSNFPKLVRSLIKRNTLKCLSFDKLNLIGFLSDFSKAEYILKYLITSVEISTFNFLINTLLVNGLMYSGYDINSSSIKLSVFIVMLLWTLFAGYNRALLHHVIIELPERKPLDTKTFFKSIMVTVSIWLISTIIGIKHILIISIVVLSIFLTWILINSIYTSFKLKELNM